MISSFSINSCPISNIIKNTFIFDISLDPKIIDRTERLYRLKILYDHRLGMTSSSRGSQKMTSYPVVMEITFAASEFRDTILLLCLHAVGTSWKNSVIKEPDRSNPTPGAVCSNEATHTSEEGAADRVEIVR